MSQTPNATENTGPDPSMEEILASIRRILNEEEAPNEPARAAPEKPYQEPVEEDDVLVLDQSMVVTEPEPVRPAAALDPSQPTGLNVMSDETSHRAEQILAQVESEATPSHPAPVPESNPPAYGSSLVAPETAAATASSVDGLLRTLSASRSTQVHRGGPTIEDLVREEVRPLLKDWLDTHLPPLVERLVRLEIERVVGRIVP
jgi:cell pole-organizing protein PopZ